MHRAKWVGLCLGAAFLLLCAALLIIRPYARLERLANDLLTDYAPAGTTVEGIKVGFPSTIVLTSLALPVGVNGQPQQVFVEKLSGTLSVLSLLRGRMDTEMNSDFFGGILWLKLRADATPRGSPEEIPFISFEARARNLDISQLCDFFRAPIAASGRCDADMEAELDERDITNLSGRALVIGERIEIPPVDVEMLTLPANREVDLTAKLSVDEGKVLVESFRSEGTAYDLSGNGIIRLADPVKRSRIDCSLSVVFRERFSVTDERLAGKATEHIVDTLVANRSKLSFRLVGTLEKPDVRLDPASSLDSIIRQLNR